MLPLPLLAQNAAQMTRPLWNALGQATSRGGVLPPWLEEWFRRIWGGERPRMGLPRPPLQPRPPMRPPAGGPIYKGPPPFRRIPGSPPQRRRVSRPALAGTITQVSSRSPYGAGSAGYDRYQRGNINMQRGQLADYYRRMGITSPIAYQSLGVQPPKSTTPAPPKPPGLGDVVGKGVGRLNELLRVPPPGQVSPLGGVSGAGGGPAADLLSMARQRMGEEWEAISPEKRQQILRDTANVLARERQLAEGRLNQQTARIYGPRAGQGTGQAAARLQELERASQDELARQALALARENLGMTQAGRSEAGSWLANLAGLDQDALRLGLQKYLAQRGEEERGRGAQAENVLGLMLLALLQQYGPQVFQNSPMKLGGSSVLDLLA